MTPEKQNKGCLTIWDGTNSPILDRPRGKTNELSSDIVVTRMTIRFFPKTKWFWVYTTLLPKKILKRPSELKAENLGTQHTRWKVLPWKIEALRVILWMPQATGLLLGNSLAVNDVLLTPVLGQHGFRRYRPSQSLSILTDPVCSMTSSKTHRDHCLSCADPPGAWNESITIDL